MLYSDVTLYQKSCPGFCISFRCHVSTSFLWSVRASWICLILMASALLRSALDWLVACPSVRLCLMSFSWSDRGYVRKARGKALFRCCPIKGSRCQRDSALRTWPSSPGCRSICQLSTSTVSFLFFYCPALCFGSRSLFIICNMLIKGSKVSLSAWGTRITQPTRIPVCCVHWRSPPGSAFYGKPSKWPISAVSPGRWTLLIPMV